MFVCLEMKPNNVVTPQPLTLLIAEYIIQLVAKLLDPLEYLPLDPMVNEACNIERYGNKIPQIITNMILSQYLELKQSLL